MTGEDLECGFFGSREAWRCLQYLHRLSTFISQGITIILFSTTCFAFLWFLTLMTFVCLNTKLRLKQWKIWYVQSGRCFDSGTSLQLMLVSLLKHGFGCDYFTFGHFSLYSGSWGSQDVICFGQLPPWPPQESGLYSQWILKKIF